MDHSREGPLAPHIAAVTLGVRDVRRSVDFYRAMGLTPDVRSDARVAVFQLNGVLLQLVRRGIIEPEMAGGQPGGGLVSLRHNVGTPTEVDTVIRTVARAGGRVLRVPQVGGGTHRRAWFADPDGHRWEVAYDSSLRRDPKGGVWLPPREVLSPFDSEPGLVSEEDTEDLGHALVTAEVPMRAMDAAVAMVEEYEDGRPTVVMRDRSPPLSRTPRPQNRARTTPKRRATPRALPRVRPRPAPVPNAPPNPSVSETKGGWVPGRLFGVAGLLLAFLAGSAVAWGLLQYVLP